MSNSAYLINLDGDPVTTVGMIADIERFGLDAVLGVYIVDVIHSEEVDGYTSWRWGTMTKHWNSLVAVEPDGISPPDHRC